MIYRWNEINVWEPLVDKIFSNTFPQHYAEIESYPKDYPFTVLKPIDLVDASNSFWSSFDKIEYYHGCRPVDPSVYFKEGVKPLDTNKTIDDIVQLSNEGKLPTVQRKQVEAKAQETMHPERENKVFFCVDKEILTSENATHYLEQGGEYFQIIVKRLFGENRGKELLCKIGVPTILIAHVPLSEVEKETREDIFWSMKDNWAEKKIDIKCVLHEEDHTVVFHDGMPPEYLVNHEHPKKLQRFNQEPYYLKSINCPLCESMANKRK